MNAMRLFILLALAGLSTLSGAAYAAMPPDPAELDATLSEANSLFEQANAQVSAAPDAAKELYKKAILRYERLAQEGGVRNGKLYYNLGNAYFLSGDIGRAMLNYLRARQYIPNDSNLLQNLAYVRNQRADAIQEPERARVLQTIFFWHYDLSAKTRMCTFIVFFMLLWTAAALRLFIRRTALHYAIGITAVFSLLFFCSLAAEAVSQLKDATGVIMPDETVARMGNGESYQPAFKEPLHAGTEFQLEEVRGDWHRIELRDGRSCWIPASAAELVRPEKRGAKTVE